VPPLELERTVDALLGAKRLFGGQRSSAKKTGVPDEMLARITTALKGGAFDTNKHALGKKGKRKLCNAILDRLQMVGHFSQFLRDLWG